MKSVIKTDDNNNQDTSACQLSKNKLKVKTLNNVFNKNKSNNKTLKIFKTFDTKHVTATTQASTDADVAVPSDITVELKSFQRKKMKPLRRIGFFKMLSFDCKVNSWMLS